MKLFTVVSIFVFLSFWVYPNVVKAQGEGDAAPVCRILPHHKPAADVAYQAGVDVHGRSVVPADLNGGLSFGAVAQVIKVPLEVDLAQRVNGLSDLIQMKADLGMLEIYKDGRVLHEGKDISAPIYHLCNMPHKAVMEKDTVKPKDENNLVEQAVPEDVESATTVEKIITHRPDLIPEVIGGEDYREDDYQ